MQGVLGFSVVARQARRLFGPRDGAARQDVLAAADVGNEAWVAFGTAEKQGDMKSTAYRAPGKRHGQETRSEIEWA